MTSCERWMVCTGKEKVVTCLKQNYGTYQTCQLAPYKNSNTRPPSWGLLPTTQRKYSPSKQLHLPREPCSIRSLHEVSCSHGAKYWHHGIVFLDVTPFLNSLLHPSSGWRYRKRFPPTSLPNYTANPCLFIYLFMVYLKILSGTKFYRVILNYCRVSVAYNFQAETTK
jgi:hypothetical protein